MSPEMKELLTSQLDAAQTRDEIDKALVSSMRSLVDCQCKTAQRVKELSIEADRRKQRFEGAKWLWGALATLAASGGGAMILKLLASWQGGHP